MAATIVVLWSLGVLFLGLLWAGFLISLFQVGLGLLARRVRRKALATPGARTYRRPPLLTGPSAMQRTPLRFS